MHILKLNLLSLNHDKLLSAFCKIAKIKFIPNFISVLSKHVYGQQYNFRAIKYMLSYY